MANQIKYQVGFDVQKQGLNQLKSSLQQIQKLKISDVMKIDNSDASAAAQTLRQVKTEATNVENALKKAFNTKLNTLNIDAFNKALKSSGSSLDQVHQAFSKVGASGQAAFNNVATQILNTNVQLRQSNKLLDSLATSFANTVKWSITSSIVNNISSSIQSAYYYAKDLDRSLTDITIVTGQSADQMERFAQTANTAAKDLGRSTLDYTKAALSFYQQGLSDEEVQARTSVTLKAENITGIGSDMIDYLTSVWNGFNVSAEDAEQYVDKLAAVADTTASNMGQLATAISKVASTANAMGVDIDQLNGQIATVIATTRQAPESVGVAFKTIYARMNDIKAGADEAQVSLGNYSGKMAALGFSVLDANGQLRDTGEVIEEIGGRWQELTREQQINLAQTMAGQRQYNNLIALFDNWDKYIQSVNTSMNAQGTLNEKNDRYLESLEAHMIQLGTEAERTYDILFDEKTVKGFVDGLSGALDIFNDFIEGLGGGGTALAYFGSLVASIFNKQIAQAIQGVGTEIDRLRANLGSFEAKQKAIESIKSGIQIQWAGEGQQLGNNALNTQAAAAQKTLAVQRGLTLQQQKQSTQIQKQIGLTQQKIDDLENEQNLAKQKVKTLTEELGFQKLSKEQIQLKNAYLKEDFELTLQSKAVLDTVGIALKTQVTERGKLKVTDQERANLLNKIKNEEDNIIAIYRDQNKEATNLESKVNKFQEKIEIVKRGIQSGNTGNKKFKEAWEEINAVINKTANDQSSAIVKTEALLKNIGVDTSKLTEEEKKRLAVLLEQNNALVEQGKKTLNLQNMVKGLTSAGQILSSWAGSAKVFGDQLATAEQKANALTSGIQGTISGIGSFFGPVGMGISTLANGIISLVKETTPLGDMLEDVFKTTKQRVQELNDAINKSNDNNKTKNAQIANLQQVAEEYEKLSEKAGAYGVNLDNLTQDEQNRYHEITDAFVEYNQAVIVGYDDQGHAIVKGQDALRETIEVLKEARRQADKAAFGGTENVLSGISARHEQEREEKQSLVDDAQARRDEASSALTEYQTNHDFESRDSDFRSFLGKAHAIGMSAGLAKENETFSIQLEKYSNLIEKYNEIIADGITDEEISDLNDFQTKIANSGTKIIQLLKDADVWTQGYADLDYDQIFANILGSSDEMLDALQTQLDDREKALQDALGNQGKETHYTEEDAATLLKAFSIDDINRELYDGLEEELFKAGLSQKDLLTLIIKDITQTVDTVPVQEVYNSMIEKAQSIYDTLVQSGQMIKKAEDQSVQDVQKILTTNNQTAGQLADAIKDSINQNWFNSPQIQEMMNDPQQKDMILNIIKSIYGLEDLTTTLSDGKYSAFIVDPVQKVGEDLRNALKDLKGQLNLEDWLSTKDQIDLGKWANETLQPWEIEKVIEEMKTLDAESVPKTIEEMQSWIQEFLKQDAHDSNIDAIVKNFDKVSNAISKLQSGKDLSYKEQVNLLSAIYPDEELDVSKIQNTEQLLKDFQEAVLSTDNSLVRAEGLSLLVTNFEKLDQLKSKIKPAEYQSLWNDIFGQEVKALNLTEDQLKQFAEANNLAFNSNETKQAALNLYKQNQSLGKLQKAVDSAKDKLNDYKSAQSAVQDSQALNHLQTLNELFASLGINVDYQWIVDNIDKISEALKNGTFNAETFKKQVEEATSNGSSFDNFQTGKKELSTLTSVRDTLAKNGELSDEQLAALAKANQEYSSLNAAAQNGANSKEYLDVLGQVISAKQTELEVTKELALAENEKNKQALENRKNELENALKSTISKEEYQAAKNDGINTKEYNDAKLITSQPESMSSYEELESAADTVKAYENQQKIIQAYEDQQEKATELKTVQDDILENEKERLILQQQLNEAKLDEDVDKEQWKNLADHIQDVATQSEQLANSLQTDRDAAQDLSEEILRFDDACQDVAKSYKDWMKALNSGSIQEQVQAMSQMRDAYGDLLNIDGDALSEGFLSSTQHLNDMKAAIDGDMDAYNRLVEASKQDIAMQVGLDMTKFQADFDDLMNKYYEGQNLEDMQIGASLNDEGFLNGLSEMINAAHMTKDQATSYLADMGVNAEVVQQDTEAEEVQQHTGFIGHPTQDYGRYDLVYQEDVGHPVQHQTGEITIPGATYEAVPSDVTNIKQNKAFSLKVTSANKSSGGGFKFSQAKNGGGSAGSARRAGSGGSGGRKGGGGGKKGSGSKGSAAKPDKGKKDKKKKIEDDRDIYHDINIQIEKINNNLDRVQKKQDELTGKKLLDNLNQQVKLLEQQKKKLEKKLELQEKDLVSQQKSLKKLGATFDAYGNISNYMTLLGKKQKTINDRTKRYNELVKEYNKETNKDRKDKLKEKLQKVEKQIKKNTDAYDDLNEKIKDYDKSREDIEKSKDDIADAQKEIYEKNIEKFNMQIDVQLDLDEAKRDWNEFYRDVIDGTDIVKDSNFDKIFADAAKSSRDVFSYLTNNGSMSSIESLTKHIKDIQNQINQIDKKGSSAIYGTDKKAALEDLKKNLASLQTQLRGLNQSIGEIDQTYLDTIDDIDDQFSKQSQDYEYVEELLTHDLDLLTLLYGDKNYQAMDKYYAQLNENSNKHIDFLRQQADFWKERWQAAVDAGDTQAAEKFEQKYRNTIGNLNSLIEQSIKTIQDKYANTIDGIFDQLDRKITDGKGSDFIEKEWDLLNKNADEYYDTINAAFALQDLRSQYNQAINSTKDLKNQQALKKLMDEQLKNLEDKDKLTEYDVERAQKLLELEQARIALQDAAAQKTTLRLKRDSQGNYSYQYVADEDGIADAQQKLASINRDLYNFDKERYNTNLSDALSAWKEFQSQYKAIMNDMNLSKEERQNQASLLEKQYAEYINGKLKENAVIRKNLTDSALQDYAIINNLDIKNLKNLSEEEKNVILGDLVPTWDAGIQKMIDAMSKEGGLLEVCQQTFKELKEANKDYEKDVEKTAESAKADFDKNKEGVSQLTEETKKLITANDTLINNMNRQMSVVSSLRNQIHALADAYKEVYKNAILAASAVQGVIEGEGSKSSIDLGGGKSLVGTGNLQGILYDVDKTRFLGVMEQMLKEFQGLFKHDISSYDTGGYTGSWSNSNGKLGLLHQKEIVLNANDTQNLLNTVSILRNMSSSLSGLLFTKASNIRNGYDSLFDNSNAIEQNMNIEAVFPNVNSKREIEEAFYELANMAAQRALKY